MPEKIKVLVVDDSILFREVLLRGISSDPDIEVVATASDPYEARDKIIAYDPDVMTCDVEMPKMNGIEFIRRLMPQYPLPIIVVSAAPGTVFDALRAGAVEFTAKPDLSSAANVGGFINDLVAKIKIASKAKVQNYSQESKQSKIEDSRIEGSKIADSKIKDSSKIIAIGASTGGTEAIYNVLKGLVKDTPGIVIVQHIPANFSRMFAERLNGSVEMEVREAKTGDYVQKGLVLIAPGDKHMIIRRLGGRYKVECFQEEKVNGHCPSVDVLFESVAREAGNNAIGVILTGMGYDGAKGLMSMKRKGARTIGQDEKSSVVYGMPKVAYNIGAVEKQVSLDNVAASIYSMLK